MQVIYVSLSDKNLILDKINLCLGYFDGLHLGHQDLIASSQDGTYKSGLLTFDFTSTLGLKNKQVLTTIDDKIEILSALKMDYLFILKFTDVVKNLSPKAFINFLNQTFNINKLVCGEDFHFGKDAIGNSDYLKKYFKVDVITLREIDHEKVSSSLIIKHLKDGDCLYAYSHLGRYYAIQGKVIKGHSLGRTIDYPTANIDMENYVEPKDGVYAVIVIIGDKQYRGFCNIGVHPTINQLSKSLLEVNIFDFNGDLYDKNIKVLFIKFLREQIKFASLDDLVKQLDLDKAKAKNALENINL